MNRSGYSIIFQYKKPASSRRSYIAFFAMAFYKVLFVVASVCLPFVQSFLLNSNDSRSGFGNDKQDHLSRRIDNLQAQIQLQNKTLESQTALIQQLLNYSRQSPSTETISNELAVLRTVVQRIMD